MFFRNKKTKTGVVLKLLESYRDHEGVPRHRTVTSLGNAAIPIKERKIIAREVDRILYNKPDQYPLIKIEFSKIASEWIDKIIRKVTNEGKWSPVKESKKTSECIDGVLQNEVEHTNTTLLGPVLAGWEAWKSLRMEEHLLTAGFSKPQCDTAAISVLHGSAFFT